MSPPVGHDRSEEGAVSRQDAEQAPRGGRDHYEAEKVTQYPRKSAISMDERPWHHFCDVFCPYQQFRQPQPRAPPNQCDTCGCGNHLVQRKL